MKQHCLACGIEKDPAILEGYPHSEDGLTPDPINPLIKVDCQGSSVEFVTDWRRVLVCHNCFHKLDVDMWISDRCWRSLDPVTAFDDLPKIN